MKISVIKNKKQWKWNSDTKQYLENMRILSKSTKKDSGQTFEHSKYQLVSVNVCSISCELFSPDHRWKWLKRKLRLLLDFVVPLESQAKTISALFELSRLWNARDIGTRNAGTQVKAFWLSLTMQCWPGYTWNFDGTTEPKQLLQRVLVDTSIVWLPRKAPMKKWQAKAKKITKQTFIKNTTIPREFGNTGTRNIFIQFFTTESWKKYLKLKLNVALVGLRGRLVSLKCFVIYDVAFPVTTSWDKFLRNFIIMIWTYDQGVFPSFGPKWQRVLHLTLPLHGVMVFEQLWGQPSQGPWLGETLYSSPVR